MNTKVVHVICFPKNYTSCWQNLFLIRTGKGNTVREKYMKNTRNTNKIHILHHVEYIYLCVLKYKFMNLEHILCNTLQKQTLYMESFYVPYKAKFKHIAKITGNFHTILQHVKFHINCYGYLNWFRFCGRKFMRQNCGTLNKILP